MCEFDASTVDTFRRHISTSKHTNIRFFCDHCEYQTMEHGTLKRHEALHKPASLECSMCNYKTKNKANLSRHIKTNHDSNSFLCDICGSSYKILLYLKKHKKLVHGGKSFTCSECDCNTSGIT